MTQNDKNMAISLLKDALATFEKFEGKAFPPKARTHVNFLVEEALDLIQDDGMSIAEKVRYAGKTTGVIIKAKEVGQFKDGQKIWYIYPEEV